MKLRIAHKMATECYEGSSEHGNSTVFVTCPFCNESMEVYKWSFAACGKFCETKGCTAHIYSSGNTYLMSANLTDAQYEMLCFIERSKCLNPDAGWQPSKRTLNSLIKHGLVVYGKLIIDGKWTGSVGYVLTASGLNAFSESVQ